MSETRKFSIEERVRWGDVDAARIIFYGAYIRFFEFAETELFRAVGLPYGVMFDELDIWLPRAHTAAYAARSANSSPEIRATSTSSARSRAAPSSLSDA